MTDLIARLTALEKEATPGEWKASGPYASESGSHYCEPCDMHEEHSPKDCPGNIVGPVLVDVGDYGTFNQPDTHFIVELRNNFDAILHALKVQEAAERWEQSRQNVANRALREAEQALSLAVKGEQP